MEPGDYVAIQAYLDPEDGVVDAIEDARTAIRDRLAVATTFGLGPRFLHSTGQLHKGGPPTGVFVQVLGQDATDLDIPGRDYSFSTLKQAQAAGDLATLREHGLRAARIGLPLRPAGPDPLTDRSPSAHPQTMKPRPGGNKA